MTTMPVSNEHFKFLSDAFQELLGVPTPGSMAYVRCLPSEVVSQLCEDHLLDIPGWQVFTVSRANAEDGRVISADRAVDLRERKEGSILLLVDERSAGAGMDGIYSAVREIRELELFNSASEFSRKSLNPKVRKFAKKALETAPKIGKRNGISPWKQFDFYARCASCPEDVGGHVALLGFWPIETGGKLDEDFLVESARMVERLLLTVGSANTAHARIESLLLEGEIQDQVRDLEQLLRETEGERWTGIVFKAVERPNLWLNRLKPGFRNQELRSIDLDSGRKNPKSKPQAWTGLKLPEDSIPVFYAGSQMPSKLQVRWKTTPSDLKAGSVIYQVKIVTGPNSDAELLSKTVPHTGKSFEKCVFSWDDFEDADFDENGKWEVEIHVHPVGYEPSDSEDDALWRRTEPFFLTFDEHDDSIPEMFVGKKARALVEEAVHLAEEDFEEACSVKCEEDPKGYVAFRVSRRSGRVYRPPLIRLVEEDWKSRDFAPGRWVIRVREEGSATGPPDFVPLPPDACDPAVRKKVEDATRQLWKHAEKRCGFVGLIHHNSEASIKYVREWTGALESGSPNVALANTVEVQSQSGVTLGLIVLPSHALRVAWHQAYDELAYHARYKEDLKPAQIVKALAPIDGSYFPAILPGLSGDFGFVFGDTLGFHAVAMIHSNEKEPQAAIALMARCLSSVGDDVAPSVGNSTAKAIGREIERYAELHPFYNLLRINSLRPGDGRTVVRALGLALNRRGDEELEGESGASGGQLDSYILDLFPSETLVQKRLVGRHLSETCERRRAGVSAVPQEDRWMLDTCERDGVSLPCLRWSKRRSSLPEEPGHITVAFDSFDSSVVALPDSELKGGKPIEAFGLFPSIVRSFYFDPVPTWFKHVALECKGDKHPVSASLTDRLQKVHAVILRSAASSLGGQNPSWPVLKTEVTAERADSLKRLHELSDWVITVDRNAGLEFFDAPRQNPEVYDTYVIDCVPERQDLESVQLVTSTIHVEEVMRLLDQSLADMGLSCSPRNCRFLLSRLKAVSGRLAMRLSNQNQSRGELIALALFYSCCDRIVDHKDWMSTRTGFFMPLDDVRDLLLSQGRSQRDERNEEDQQNALGAARADLVYVDLPKKGGLRFTFIEIKYRRLLRSARQSTLLEHIRHQNAKTRKRLFDDYFSEDLTATQLAVRRKRLARALQFYADKAHRHELEDEAHKRLSAAIDKLYQPDADVAREDCDDRGYVFCPDHTGDPVEIDYDGSTRIFLFGPGVLLPDMCQLQEPSEAGSPPFESVVSMSTAADPENQEMTVGVVRETKRQDQTAEEIDINSDGIEQPLQERRILLGHTQHSDLSVEWRFSIRGNPHLMIVGLPGMGKTTCIANLCIQLSRMGVVPIVFSYHDDIEQILSQELGELKFVDMEMGIGFNPLRVVGRGPHAWIDNVAMLRDIFAAIYPDLGDLQTNEIREAIKQAYTDLGYGVPGVPPGELPTPEFQRFFDILRQKPKPNPGVIARLNELNDYGFYRHADDPSSLLEAEKPVIVRLYMNQNEVLQNALASFVLFNIYQNMFIRGVQERLTHAIIFDEAHRASRLKLLPIMAKECRKYGISLITASQAAKDFNLSLYSAIANYLVLRVTEADALVLAKNVVQTTEVQRIVSRLKQLDKFTAMFFSEGSQPTRLKLYWPA